MLDEARGGKSGQYGRFPTWAAALPGLGGRTLAVLAAIAHHADAEGRAFPGMSRIASLAGIKRTDAAVDEADKRIAARCNELGIPERFRPSLHLSWYSRGENASGKRRAELRKVAESRIEALEKKARYDIDNWCVKTQAALIKDSLTSAQAAAFLEQMPTAEQLMPTLDASRIASLLPGGNPLIEVAGR